MLSNHQFVLFYCHSSNSQATVYKSNSDRVQVQVPILQIKSICFQVILSIPHQIDVLINNGGRSQRSLFLETNVDVYQALMELNFLGTVSITKQVLPHMTQRGSGSIVTVSSLVGLAGAPLATGYSATKHALQVKGFLEILDFNVPGSHLNFPLVINGGKKKTNGSVPPV